MSESTNERLSHAFDLIEADQRSQALEILEPMLSTQQDNPDVWWLYAHAVDDMAPAESALNRVSQLDPNYPGVTNLLQALEERKSGQVPIDTSLSGVDSDNLVSKSTDDDFLDDLDSDDLFHEEDQGSSASQSQRQMLTLLAIPVVIVLLLLFVFVVVNPFGSEDEDAATPTPNTLAQSATLPSDPVIVDTPVVVVPTATSELPVSSADDVAATVETALDDAGLVAVEGETTTQTTSIGETLLVSVCSGVGATLRDTLTQAMPVIASALTDIDDSIDAVGARFVDCDNNNNILNVIAVDVDSAQSFASGDISANEFRTTWRPVG